MIDTDESISVAGKMKLKINSCSKDCYLTFFKDTKMDDGYVDAGLRHGEVRIGIEPSYMYERLKMFVISERKELSRIETGYSWGGWGTDIRSSTQYYKDKKTNCKFVRFIDKWHPVLFPH